MSKNEGIRQDPEKLKKVILLRKSGKTLHEIGNDVGVSGERIRQILAKEVKSSNES